MTPNCLQGESGPLAGIKVLDFSGYIAGPFCTMLLADMGAEVIKVEPPGGEQWRHQDPFAPSLSKSFVALNRNKRSIILDLKRAIAKDAVQKLIARSDVLVHSYRPGVAERLGLGCESATQLNPRLIYASNSAFGSKSPRAQHPGYDLVIQAASGLLAGNWPPDGRAPRRYSGIALVDFTAGNMLALGVVAALLERGRTGVAKRVESSLFDAALSLQRQSLLSIEGIDDASGAAVPVTTRERLSAEAQRVKSVASRELYYRTYESADGFVTVGCLNIAQRLKFAAALSVADPWYGNPDRIPGTAEEDAARRQLTVEAEAQFRKKTSSEWVRTLEDLGVPCGVVRLGSDLMSDTEIQAGGYMVTFDLPGYGKTRSVGTGVRVGDGTRHHRSPPDPGQDTTAVLRELGYAPTSMAEFSTGG